MRGFILDDRGAREISFSDASNDKTATLRWLHIDGRGDPGEAWIAGQTDIPELARTALFASETRPRSDIFGEGALINLRGLGTIPRTDSDALVSVRIWATAGRVTSVSLRPILAVDEVIAEFIKGELTDAGDVLTAFADAITDTLDPQVAALGDTLDDIESKLESESVYRVRRKVSGLRSDAIAYRRFVTPQRTALERLATKPSSWLDDNDRLHLREASDRFARMAEELESVRERSAIIHEQLTDLHAEQIDQRSLLISIYALVFLPLTFITGLFGMNVPIPFQDSRWMFWEIIIGCVFIALGGLIMFVRHRWINRRGSID